MPKGFDGSRFVYVDVSGGHGKNALVGGGHGIDDGSVGLCASRKKEDVGIGALSGFPYLDAGGFAPLVVAVGGTLQVVGF